MYEDSIHMGKEGGFSPVRSVCQKSPFLSEALADGERALLARGIHPEDARWVADMLQAESISLSIPTAAELLQRIFARVEQDSLAGAALVIALGLERGRSLAEIAAVHGKSKQALQSARDRIERKLGLELTLLARHAQQSHRAPEPELAADDIEGLDSDLEDLNEPDQVEPETDKDDEPFEE